MYESTQLSAHSLHMKCDEVRHFIASVEPVEPVGMPPPSPEKIMEDAYLDEQRNKYEEQRRLMQSMIGHSKAVMGATPFTRPSEQQRVGDGMPENWQPVDPPQEDAKDSE